MTKFLIVCFFLMNCPIFFYSQTCVILKIMDNKSIYVGADSRVSLLDNNGNLTGESFQMCKIQSVSKLHFAHINRYPNYAYPMIKESCRKGGTFSEIITRYCNRFTDSILPKVLKYSVTAPDLFKKLIDDSVLASTLFFGFENDSPFVVVAIFKVSITIRNTLRMAYDFKTSDVIFLGDTESVDSLVYDKTIWQNGAVRAIKKLLNMADNAEVMVSPPFDIIKVTKNGDRWIKRKKMCRESTD